MKEKIIILIGCTCSGKTGLSVKLAKQFNCEIVNCDATQFYKELNIGTDKISKSEMEGIPHHLISFLDVEKNYSISEFNITAKKIITEITTRKKVPLLVGASGLYILSLLYPYVFTEERDEDFRSLYEFTSNEELLESLRKIDPDEAIKLHANNRRRILRALEIFYKTGKTKTQLLSTKDNKPNYNFLILEICLKKEIIDKKIIDRANKQFENGFVNEVFKIISKHPKAPIYNSFQSIGYKEVYDHIINKKNLEETKQLIINRTIKLSKRQKQFFKNKFVNKFVFNNLGKNNILKINNLIKKFLL